MISEQGRLIRKNNPANKEEAFVLAAFDMFEQLYRTSLITDNEQRKSIFRQHLQPLVATLELYDEIKYDSYVHIRKLIDSFANHLNTEEQRFDEYKRGYSDAVMRFQKDFADFITKTK